jgi:hypothetical protein
VMESWEAEAGQRWKKEGHREEEAKRINGWAEVDGKLKVH